jgi:GH24 family phage-related lysozyme (muramidase)
VKQVVRDHWIEFTEPLEGGLNYLYADVLNLITTGYGNLVDPVSIAMGLPWMVDGRAARGDEIATQWHRVKNDPMCARRGHLYAKGLTTIRLTPEGVAQLVYRKLESNDAVLTGRFGDMQDWPACAVMAVHSVSWACGPSFRFPKLSAALNARDFDAASVHCTINEWSGTVHNVGVVPRNVANRILFLNAARVDAFKLDPDTLHWTGILGVSDAETQPAIDNPDSEPENAASQPTIHVMPDTLDAWRRRDE